MSRAGFIRWVSALALAAVVAVIATDGAPAFPLAATASSNRGAADSQPVLKFVSNPEPVPAFSLRSLGGQTLDPSQWRGKVVILNFWATWCGPCRMEIPELVQLQKRFQGSLQVVGLSVDEAPPAQVKSFADRLGFNYPVAMASDDFQNRFGGILALPTSFVLDRQGHVVQKHVGLISQEYYEQEISYLAGQQTNAKIETFVDQGQIFPANVKNAREIPGINMTRLTEVQRKAALRLMNEKHCSCGCDYTVAQCRILDTACAVSQKAGQDIADSVSRGTATAKPVAAPKPST